MGLLKKITRPIKKVVQKVVPKELAGIMQVAAPFTGAAAPFVYAAGALKQTGRINPILTAGSLLPGVRFQGGQGLAAFKPTGFTRFGPQNFGSGITARQLLFGGPGLGESGKLGRFGDTAERFLFGSPAEGAFDREAGEFVMERGAKQGLFGTGGEFGLTKGSLIRKADGTLNKTNIAAMAASGVSLATATKQIEEEAVEAGASDSELDALRAEAADFWSTLSSDDFKVTPTLAKGGRVGFGEGTDPNVPNDPKSRDIMSYAKFRDMINPKNYFMTPRETDDFQTMQKERFMYDYEPKMPEKMLDKIRKLLDKDDRQASADPMTILNQMAIDMFNKPLSELTDREREMIMSFMKPNAKKGGLMRQNLALGTRPTAQESGLGGLPIEADMRYSGGFMPYGAKEKADDVPARLSKNEFVFTADAVRAAGGGSVQKGAQRMYNTMKQLEAMGKA